MVCSVWVILIVLWWSDINKYTKYDKCKWDHGGVNVCLEMKRAGAGVGTWYMSVRVSMERTEEKWGWKKCVYEGVRTGVIHTHLHKWAQQRRGENNKVMGWDISENWLICCMIWFDVQYLIKKTDFSFLLHSLISCATLEKISHFLIIFYQIFSVSPRYLHLVSSYQCILLNSIL